MGGLPDAVGETDASTGEKEARAAGSGAIAVPGAAEMAVVAVALGIG